MSEQQSSPKGHLVATWTWVTGYKVHCQALPGRERTEFGWGPGAGAVEVGPGPATMVVLAAVGAVLSTELRPINRPPNRPAGGDGEGVVVVVAEAVLVVVG